MGTKCNPEVLNPVYKNSLCISKVELTQEIGVRPMAVWVSVPVKIFIVPVLHIQIGLGNDVLNDLPDFIYYDVEK